MELYDRHLCECGCGFPTTRIKQTSAAQGRVRGEYNRFLPGHKGKTAEGGILYELRKKPKPPKAKPASYWSSARDQYGKIRM